MKESGDRSQEVDETQPDAVVIPRDTLQSIKAGWIAAIVNGGMSFVLMLIAINTDIIGELFDIWLMIDVVLIFALALGIYKKSRFAATFMFIYYPLSKIAIIVEIGKPVGIILSLVFLYFYFHAMVATYRYHKLLDVPRSPSSGESSAS